MKEKRENDAGHRLLDQMSEISGMPKDVALGAPILTATGQTELMIENYRGILEYTELMVRVQTKAGQIKITGKRLQIEYYTNDEMKITGRIRQIEYIN